MEKLTIEQMQERFTENIIKLEEMKKSTKGNIDYINNALINSKKAYKKTIRLTMSKVMIGTFLTLFVFAILFLVIPAKYHNTFSDFAQYYLLGYFGSMAFFYVISPTYKYLDVRFKALGLKKKFKEDLRRIDTLAKDARKQYKELECVNIKV